MSGALFLLLPQPGADDGLRDWWLVGDGAVADSGADDGWRDFDLAAVPVIALAPAAAAPVHWLTLPGLTPPQAATAARLAVAERLLGDTAAQHIVPGTANAEGQLACAVVDRAVMAGWLALLADAGLTVQAVAPLAALVAPPGPDAALRAELPGGAVLAAGMLTAAADPAIDTLRGGAQTVQTLTQADIDARLIGWASAQPLNLLSGPFAPRRAAALSPATRRWLVRLAAAAVLLTLAVPLAQRWQWARAEAAADERALAAAARVKIAASDAAAAEAELDRRLAARGGGPLALSAPLGGLYRALKAEPAVALRSLTHGADGTASVTLAAPRIEDVNDVLKALQVAGFTITAQPMSGSDGMQMATVTVRAVP
jgi:general secretion pathway protein L